MDQHIPLDEVYIFQLDKAFKQFKKYSKDRFVQEGIDLTSDQWVLLKRISEGEGINQRELAKVSFREPASVTRTLDILQKKGLILRQEGKEDRRVYELFLSEAGKKYLEKLIPIAKGIRAKGVEGISVNEVALLTRLLEKVFDNFS